MSQEFTVRLGQTWKKQTNAFNFLPEKHLWFSHFPKKILMNFQIVIIIIIIHPGNESLTFGTVNISTAAQATAETAQKPVCGWNINESASIFRAFKIKSIEFDSRKTKQTEKQKKTWQKTHEKKKFYSVFWRHQINESLNDVKRKNKIRRHRATRIV